MSKKEFLNNNQFATLNNLSRVSVGQAVKNKRIYRQRQGIDPHHAINIAYIQNLPKTAGKKRSEYKKQKKISAQSPPPDKPVETVQQEARDTSQNAPEDPKESQNYTAQDMRAFRAEQDNKNRIENIKLHKEEIKLAKEMKEFIPFIWVGKMMARLSGTIQNYFLSLDERLTPEIMATCKINDIEKQLQVKKLIGDEIGKGLEQVMDDIKKLDFIKSSEFKGNI
jgi:hypothetical protein